VDYVKLLACTGFVWDEGKAEKNWEKHKVSRSECEQIFFNDPLVVAFGKKHSQSEERYYALGRTDNNRGLFVVFTRRHHFIRVISARPMSRSERRWYEKENSNLPD
jgi:hypothetical protein